MTPAPPTARRRRPPVVRLLALALAAAACSATAGDGAVRATGEDRATPRAEAQVASSPREDVPSALDDPSDDRFPEPLLDPDELRSGGPPPDGIPAIDKPRFLDAADVGFLEDDEPVLALRIGDKARAYPVQVLIWHEIVNDTVDGIPVAVTYCPLCNSAIAYDRRAGDRVLSFGTSGMLYNSALVMYDRQTESLWSHFTGEAVIGHLTGTQLDVFPVATVSWEGWKAAHPEGLVLSRETGFSRSYGRNPYPGYDQVGSTPFLFDGDIDGRLEAKARVVGVTVGDRAAAVPFDALAGPGVVEMEVGGTALVVWLAPGTASALDASSVSDGRDIGATGVFRPEAGGRRLHFERTGDAFVDRETGSRWNVFGRALDGPLAGTQLEAVPHVDTFWFAWAAFQPATSIER